MDGPVLALAGVGVGYRRGRHAVRVLADVSLEVYPGEVVSVLAPRGQGKTTLLRVAGGTERPAVGRVLLDGADVWSLSEDERSGLFGSRVGWVDMGEPETRLPVLDIVALPLMSPLGRDQAYSRARETLVRIGTQDLAAERWENLCEWQRARVAIAQGISGLPALLLVDDVMAALGIEESEQLGRLIATVAQERGFGVLASASDAKATIWSDRIASLAGGGLLVASPPRCGPVIELPTDRRGLYDGADDDPRCQALEWFLGGIPTPVSRVRSEHGALYSERPGIGCRVGARLGDRAARERLPAGEAA